MVVMFLKLIPGYRKSSSEFLSEGAFIFTLSINKEIPLKMETIFLGNSLIFESAKMNDPFDKNLNWLIFYFGMTLWNITNMYEWYPVSLNMLNWKAYLLKVPLKMTNYGLPLSPPKGRKSVRITIEIHGVTNLTGKGKNHRIWQLIS